MISPYEAGFLFVFKARRRAHSWDSVTEAATLKTGKKTHKMGILLASKSLIWNVILRACCATNAKAGISTCFSVQFEVCKK